MTGTLTFVKFAMFAPILIVEGKCRMRERKKPPLLSVYKTEHLLPKSFTPVNRRKGGALIREIGKRVRAGYYESSHVLRTIAERISGAE